MCHELSYLFDPKPSILILEENTFALILDLFRAGTETTATGLTWAIKQLVIHPDIQQQLKEEVDEVRHIHVVLCSIEGAV